ncbi:hypothetical protein, partial [Streptomyces sp. NPDC005568]|uniref:hypothetical protein n=1 Tax=Streptomyces sp. NPDC005568 TaxID=3156887 RepID=UPI0033B065A6
MPEIVLDRFHSDAWHTAPIRGETSAAPEEKYLGHLADLSEVLSEHLGDVAIRSIDARWGKDTLEGADLLILTLPTADQPPLTAEDMALLRGHLGTGRGLLVFGGSVSDTAPCPTRTALRTARTERDSERTVPVRTVVMAAPSE